MSFVAACLQMSSGVAVAANLDAVARGVREAAGAGATYVQTPEMTTVVNRHREALAAAVGTVEASAELETLRGIARDNRVVLHVGSMALRRGERLVNRAYVIDAEGEVLASYDKVHLFDVDLPGGESWRESSTYDGGESAVIADIGMARLGLAICYDIRFPQLFRAYGDAGVELLSAPACFTRQTGEAHWHVLQRARAIENGAWMLSAAQAGTLEDGRETFGHSLIVDPWGKVLADGGTAPGLIYARIDPAMVAATRGRIPNLKNARSFGLEGPRAIPRAAE